MTAKNSEQETSKERIGRLVVDADVSDDELSALVFALQRDTPFVADLQTPNRIDVFRLVPKVDHDE